MKTSFLKAILLRSNSLPKTWRTIAKLAVFGFVCLTLEVGVAAGVPIDRFALVKRHNVVLTAADIHSPLSVGNGEFAFTADITGLQTFPSEYNEGIPLSTMSQWGFHTTPSPQGFTLEKFPRTMDDSCGRPVPYLYFEKGKSPPEWEAAANYLYANPGRFHLGRIAMVLKTSEGREAKLSDLTGIHQELDLWSGEITSHFIFDGETVDVVTCCHPERDQFSARIKSPLIAKGQLAVSLAFPYGATRFGGNGADWSHPDKHQTILTRTGSQRADFARTLDADHYYAALQWSKGCTLSESGLHRFLIAADNHADSIEFIAAFSPEPLPKKLPDAAATAKASIAMWKKFWSTGGAIDLSESKDPRWRELERRIVLSQYLTRIQCCGSLPPQETGLTCNSWFGKFHLEMHWWHAAHFPLWGRSELLERSLPFYQRILPKAEAMAKVQGYEGARWPKCVGPAGDLAPTYLESFLIWQQPHPIFYSELVYRSHPNRQTLERYRELVFESAKFMASFAAWDTNCNQYRLGPPFADAAEVYFADHDHQWNPTFEIAYWRWGLETAQHWRERLGLPRETNWDNVIAHLPPLPTCDGLYVAAETATNTFRNPNENTSHPCMLAPLGILDGEGVDRETMRRTLGRVLEHWDWNNTWGWDYPMMAMTAARLGEGENAIDALLMDKPKNAYLPNGHNPQMSGVLPLYLPGNGGLLYATALMAAGWDGAPSRNAPGFPDNGQWTVRWEGLKPAP
ncbi:MAG TPA: glycoside hydrolase family 65 [Verrucomicrobiae bacterium]|nr:glycoside hydrolase family 65 [Verrucomicrobiae bacterium]